jgi:hypothetical protein
MAISEFMGGHLDVARFFDWRVKNPKVFVLNVRGRETMLHRAKCGHYTFPGGNPRTISAKKASSDRTELEEWSVAHFGKRCKLCPDCDV